MLHELLSFSDQLRQGRAEANTLTSDLRTGSNTWLSRLCNVWVTVSLSTGAIMHYLTSLSFFNLSNENNKGTHSNGFLGVIDKLVHVNT